VLERHFVRNTADSFVALKNKCIHLANTGVHDLNEYSEEPCQIKHCNGTLAVFSFNAKRINPVQD